MVHKTQIEGYNLNDLAEKIGDLRYDTLQELLTQVALKIKKDATKDRSRGRTQLATQLEVASTNIENSAKNIQKAWIICEPYT